MRVCFCFSKSSFTHYSPCPLKLEDAKHGPSIVSIVLEEKSSPNDVIEVEKNSLSDEKVEVVLRSSLKKPAGCGRGKKGRVKWMDFVGKELVETREFEALESKETEERVDSNSASMCVIL